MSQGIPLPTVTFYFNDKEMKENELIKINNVTHTINITKVDETHDGMYSCTAANSAGSVDSNPVRITVFG